jgi:putative hydrolase of the HAD superfamily
MEGTSYGRGCGSGRVRAVFFDAGGTILNVRGSVGEIYAAAVARRGYPVPPDAVDRGFRSAWRRSLIRRRDCGYISSDEVLREEWRRVVADSFDGLVPAGVAGEAFEELYDHFSGPEPWAVAPGAVETFEALRADGISLGILSNWDRRLLVCLERLGILSFFDHLVISYEVGVEKPHPRIFRTAAERAGQPPSALLMVGDSYEQDIEPAIDLGWHALWLTPDNPGSSRAPGVAAVENFAAVLRRIREV